MPESSDAQLAEPSHPPTFLRRLGFWCHAACRHREEEGRAATGPAAQSAASVSVPDTPRFEAGDPALLEYLDEHGYVVVAGVLTDPEVHTAQSLLWKFLSDQGGWMRGRPATWTDESFSRMGQRYRGIINGRGIGQSELSWFVRTRSEVKRVFAQLWQTEDLLTSFDGINVFRPWHFGFEKTVGGWFHVDQGRTMPGSMQCVQGFVSLTDQGPSTGGLVVIPGSHRLHHEICETAPDDEDYIELATDHPLLALPSKPISCNAGDLVLWDSRCLHCNAPSESTPTTPPSELLRTVVYVCMTPRAWASAEVLRLRRQAFELNVTTSHWPHRKVMGFGWAKAPKLVYAEAEARRQTLI